MEKQPKPNLQTLIKENMDEYGVLNPRMTIEEIARIAGCNPSVVTQYLRLTCKLTKSHGLWMTNTAKKYGTTHYTAPKNEIVAAFRRDGELLGRKTKVTKVF